jgi:hypothetical protein
MATFVAASGMSVKGNERISPLAFTVAVSLVLEYSSMGQVGIEDVEGIEDCCSEGIDEATSKERIDMWCSESFDAGSENASKGGRGADIEDGFEDDTLARKELPERATRMLATRENLIVADLQESLMRRV